MKRTKSVINKSKIIGEILRHNPFKYGLSISSEGWVSVSDILSFVKPIHSIELLDAIVYTDKKKQRYAYNEDKTLIRAKQGHSIPFIKIKMKSYFPQKNLFHGTTPELENVILNEGLKPMTRLQVHLSTDIETARTVGRRYSKDKKPLIFTIDKNAKLNFFISENGVVLTDYVPSKFLKVVER